MTTWTPSNEAVERAAKVLEDILGLIGSDVEIVARAALIAGHEDAAIPEGWHQLKPHRETGRKSSVVTAQIGQT